MIQMASLLVHENRAHFSVMNAIGEICAQFRSGILSVVRDLGSAEAIKLVEAYHKLYPAAAATCWYPDAIQQIDQPAWQQLYVNAEHDVTVGVITISREALNGDVISELNRAIDWLQEQKIRRVILSGDFHLSSQMTGADTAEFYPALDDVKTGHEISSTWSRAARRLNDDFELSVACITGKRCWGGWLELVLHCDYVVAVEGTSLAFPEVTLPVVPGMEGCHWPFRRVGPDHRPKILEMLLSGRPIKAEKTTGWLIDAAGSLDDVLQLTWKIANDGDHGLSRRPLVESGLDDIPTDVPGLSETLARRAIVDAVRDCCAKDIRVALEAQAGHSAKFMITSHCRAGAIGQDRDRIQGI